MPTTDASGAPSVFIEGPANDYPRESTVDEQIRAQIHRSPHSIACICGAQELRYRELDELADRMAAHLRQLGVGRGDRVGLCSVKSLDMVAALLGILRIRAAYVPIGTATPAPRIADLIDVARLRVVIADSTFSSLFPATTSVVTLDGDDWRQSHPVAAMPTDPECGAGTMYVMFTSGSTGRPKGVVVGHRSVLNLLCWAGPELAIGPGDRILQQTSIAFDVSLMELVMPLMFGAAVVLPEPGHAPDILTLCGEIQTHRITHLFLVPSLLRILLESGLAGGCASLKAVHSMGEHLPPAVRAAFHRQLDLPLFNWYGPTESTIFATCHRFTPGEGPVFLGQPVANTRLAVLDPRFQPVPVGQEGALFIGGDGLAEGYLGSPDLTEKAFVRDPFRADPSERLYCTGDRVRLHPGQALEFLGRDDRQIKVRGHLVEPGEIETVLERHPAVREAAVMLFEHGDDEGRLVAYIDAAEATANLDELAHAHVEEWQLTHDETYRQSPAADPRFNTAGWRSLLDRRMYSPPEMEEWVDQTVGRIRSLNPRRILDIGCGSGLLLHRLAQFCERYIGTDFSPSALAQLQKSTSGLPNVELLERHADNWSGIPPRDFDLILLNSVIQYFPGADHLSSVLERALEWVADGGHVFVGDVRNLDLLPAFHAHRLLRSAADSLPVSVLRGQVDAACYGERELACSPKFFRRLVAKHPRRPTCRLLVKQGVHPTEMNLFRFDVVLSPSDRSTTVKEVSRSDRPGAVDSRLAGILQTLEWIRTAAPEAVCGDLRRRDNGTGLASLVDPPESPLTNSPLRARWHSQLGEDLRRWVARHLPEPMVPSSVTFLDALPRTSNGKLDRRALQWPPSSREASEHDVPLPGLERSLADLFASVLGEERVGREDDFFSLGGHSLLALRLQNRISAELHLHLELATLFEHPTVSGLAQRLRPAVSPRFMILPTTTAVRHAGGFGPASLLQEPLWHIDRIHGAGSVVNLAAAFRMRGPLDPRRLDDAFVEITRRHEVLRSRFEELDGELQQTILPWPPSLECMRLHGPSTDELEQRTDEVVCRPFDLRSGPLVRAVLMEAGNEDHLLVVVMHHIVSDGWSMPIFFSELAELYMAAVHGRPHRLPAQALQYADFASWQREALSSGRLETSLAHWRHRLQGVEDVLEITPDYERPRVVQHRGAILSREIGRDLADALRGLAHDNDCTPFAVLLSAFLVVLSRYTSRDDLLIGTPVAGRGQAELETMIGLFTNIVPLRADLSGHPDAIELLRRARSYTIEALTHQGLPFERLVAALAPYRDPSRTPLVQVQFVLQNIPECTLNLDGVSAEPIAVSNKTAAFDVSLEVTERADGLLACAFEYRTSLYTPETIGRFADHFVAVLRGMCTNPTLPVADLPFLSESDRHELVVEWNRTEAPFHDDTTVTRLFQEQAGCSPHHWAVQCGDERLDYAEVDRRSTFLAQRLQALGLRPNDTCAICLERSIHLPVAYLAILKAGATCVPLDPALPELRIKGILADSGVSKVLTETALEPRFADREISCVSMDRYTWDQAQGIPIKPPTVCDPAGVAFLFYTSGSSGHPKGVQVLHRGLVNCLSWLQRKFPLEQGDRLLQSAPIGFDVSLAELFWPLLQGATVVLARPDGHRDPAYLIGEIQRSHVTRVILTASMLAAVLELPEASSCTSLTAAFSTGEALRPSVMQAWRSCFAVPLHNLYGPTETTLFSAFWTCPRQGNEVRIGRPIANTQLYVVDHRGHPLPIDVPGELVIGGVGVTAGYRNLPARTKESFVSGLLPEATGPLYRTGDLARFRPDGTVEYLGRMDDQVKIRGIRIEPGEIENTLLLHPGVRDTAVVAREIAPGDVRLTAFFTATDPAAPPGSEVLRAHLKTHLSPALVPGHILLLDELPRTATGKLDRRALRDGQWADAPAVLASTPTGNSNAAIVAGIFSEVLGGREVGLRDDFFDLGGHSLLALLITNRVNVRFGTDLRVSALFRHPTPSALAGQLEQSRE